MQDAASGIVKKHAVREGGSYRLSAPGSAAPAAAKVRIVHQDEKIAVLEITCTCGQKILLQCDFGEAGRSAAPPAAPGAKPAGG